MRWYVPLVLIILLVGCEKVELIDNNTTGPPIIGADDGRPDIPRSNPPQDMPDNYEEPTPRPVTNRTVFIPAGAPGTELDVPLNDAIGKHHPLITQKELPLLRHGQVRVNSNELIGYDETIRFDFGSNSTGKVIFGQDEEEIGTFLLFEEKKPILEYRLQLHKGTFEEFSGRDIQILGHTYVIAEATNKTVWLYGRSVASNLFFENGSKMEVNSTRRQDTKVIVTPRSISYVLYADEDILLSPGEGIGDTIDRLSFGTDLMDIVYKGAPTLEGATVALRLTDEGYALSAETAAGPLDLDLVSLRDGRAALGGEEKLHVAPCGYCISEDDFFIVTSSDGKSFLLRYTGLGSDHVLIRHGDIRYSYEYRGTPGVNATAEIILDKYRFPVKIGPKDNSTGEYNLSVEQGFRNGRVEIVLKNGAILRIGDVNASVLPLQLVVPAAKTIDHREQVTHLNLTYINGWRIVVGNVTFVEHKKSDDTFGSTPYGTLITLERDDDSWPLNVGKDAVIFVPVEPLYGIAVLED
jgi:hypothetical protein